MRREWRAAFSPGNTDAGARALAVREETRFAGGEFVTDAYLVLEYEADGLTRANERLEPLLVGVREGAETPLFLTRDAALDGARHRLIAKTEPNVRYDGLRLRFVTKMPRPTFAVFALYACDFDGLPGRLDFCAGGETEPGFLPIDLGGLYDAVMPDEPGSLDGGRGLPRGEAALFGVPFRFGEPGRDRVAPPSPPGDNEDVIDNFGVPAKRGLCRPTSRDGETSVEIGREARELLFVCALTGEARERWGFCAKDPTILGDAVGEVMMPLRAEDVERFQVELQYADGRRGTAFPLNLALGRHALTGETGVYAVPLEGGVLERAVFHNRVLNADASLLALTLNVSAPRRVPEIAPEVVSNFVPSRASGIERHGERLTVRAGGLEMDLDGVRVTAMRNGFAPVSSATGALVRLRRADDSLEDAADARIVRLGAREAEIACTLGGLTCRVTVTAEADEIGLRLRAENKSGEARSASLLCPALDGVRFADWRDGWYMFPKYQNACGNGRICVREESAPSFPMQFFDLYSPSQGGGMGVMTRERGLTVRRYGLEKDERAMRAWVEYPDLYLRLAPGCAFDGSPTALFAHAGDWRNAFSRYRDWLKGWYAPVKAQSRLWYRRLFWLTAEITDFCETDAFFRLPVWYDEKTGEYAFSRVLDGQEAIYGCRPDILHLWAWTYDPERQHAMWGHFGDADYDRVGGLPRFKQALADVSQKMRAEVSLYLHPTLLSDVYPEAREWFPTLRAVRDDGGFIGIHGDTYRMCHANETWRARVLDMYERVQRETGLRLLYVDEFSLRVENRCWATNHGHDAPSNLLKTDRDFIGALRERMPEEVALYGEYAAPDVNAAWIDGNITYHILDSVRDMIETSYHYGGGDDTVGRAFTDLYRFAFPKIVQTVLPMAMRNLSWQPLKSTLFNGEAIYDSFWDAEESRGREFMARAYRLKKEYADCFSSDCPETMLSSPLPGVCANRYPGDGRTLYTLYNRAYETKRGALLAIPRAEGARVYDAWNGVPCETVERDGALLVMGALDAQEVGCIAVTE